MMPTNRVAAFFETAANGKVRMVTKDRADKASGHAASTSDVRDKWKFAMNFKAALKKSKFKQVDVATEAGTDTTTLARWKREGLVQSSAVVENVCEILGVDPESMWDDEPRYVAPPRLPSSLQTKDPDVPEDLDGMYEFLKRSRSKEALSAMIEILYKRETT